MASMTVYIGALTRVDWPAPLRRRLQEHFDTIVKGQKSVSSASVVYTSRAPKLGDYDLLVYIVDSPSESVVKKLDNAKPHPDATGWTRFAANAMACEVYISGNQDDPEGMANLAFHELMHIKSRKTDNALHTMYGLSLGREEVTAETPLNSGDIKLMRQYLTTKRSIWTGGFTVYHDPF
ncbi:MAG: hypothetical protein ACRENP_01230 [Longimicrobiales bacterium]